MKKSPFLSRRRGPSFRITEGSSGEIVAVSDFMIGIDERGTDVLEMGRHSLEVPKKQDQTEMGSLDFVVLSLTGFARENHTERVIAEP